MSDGMTCYERDEALCEDGMCLRTGCRLRNKRLYAGSANGWHPIETVPKFDGCYVDLWIPKLDSEYGRISDCKWLGNERQPGWYAESAAGSYYVGERATHWRYRPEAPDLGVVGS